MSKFNLKGLESYQTDASVEAEDGIWLVFPNNRKIHVLRAGGSNTKFLRVLNKAIKPVRRAMDRGTLDPAKSDEIMIEVYLDAVILGWSGFLDEAGNEIPYSKDEARELFTMLPELFREVQNLSSDMAMFQDEEAEEIAEELGNS